MCLLRDNFGVKGKLAALAYPYKLRRSTRGDMLYNLERDPAELEDYRAAAPEVYARLARRLDAIPAVGAASGEAVELNEDQREKMEALGYL